MTAAVTEEPRHHVTCMTALNQHVLPMFFIPTGQSPTLFQSLCLEFSPQTSQRFLLERFLFSGEWTSCGLSQDRKDSEKSHLTKIPLAMQPSHEQNASTELSGSTWHYRQHKSHPIPKMFQL